MADDIEDENWDGSPIEVRFCNFVTGQSILRSAHAATVKDRIAKILAGSPSAWIDLIGYASRLGYTHGDSNQQNIDLSKRRIAAVQKEIRLYAPNIRFNVVDPEGAADSTTGTKDDGYWRAVQIRIFGATPVKPSPGPAPGPVPTASDWVCGPDVTEQVATTWTRVQTEFGGLGFTAKIHACNSIFLPFQKPEDPVSLPDNPLDLQKWKQLAQQFADINSWDTLPLFQGWSGWLRKPPIYDPKLKGPCATPSSDSVTGTDAGGASIKADQEDNFDPLHESDKCCANTVQVGGKCWLNGTANYGLFGIMIRLCHDFAVDDFRLKLTPMRDVYSLEWATGLIRAYKRFGANPEGAALPIAWAEATYRGGPRAVPAIPGNRPKCACTGPCKGDVVPWDYVWDPHHKRPAGLPEWAKGKAQP